MAQGQNPHYNLSRNRLQRKAGLAPPQATPTPMRERLLLHLGIWVLQPKESKSMKPPRGSKEIQYSTQGQTTRSGP